MKPFLTRKLHNGIPKCIIIHIDDFIFGTVFALWHLIWKIIVWN